ncbi:MAG: stalk domain-containing protein [Caldisericia bacterium]|nr:stalk domain-containing protein [Caldisericia bacterium]
MKKFIALITTVTLLFSISIIHFEIPTANAANSLVLTYSPQPLTAGCVPEMIDPNEPFTIYISDQAGNPVDLTLGGQVEDEAVWNLLFKDSHPDEIGQHYWVRTDLHNDDGSLEDNLSLFGFRPIEIDFRLAGEGIYIFKGFCANDTGSFIITAYTPDRKAAGAVRIEVVSPDVNYEIMNTEDPNGTKFTVPGNPDFIMTAGDNRIYQITAYARNAQGKMIRGIDRDINVCNGATEVARFTPFTTECANFEYNSVSKSRGFFSLNNTETTFITDTHQRYYLHLGVDYNRNGKIDRGNREMIEMSDFHVRDLDQYGNVVKTDYLTYYITSNVQWEDGSFELDPQFDFAPPYEGWGLGSIYNSEKSGGYLIADLNDDQKLDFHDSLLFDRQGSCTFYLFSEDITNVGGFVACNPYGARDVAGGPPISSSSPTKIRTRYQQDHVFFLDFDCIPTRIIGSGKPGVKVYNAKTSIELGKSFFNTANYDIVFGKENHLLFEITPGDIRDLSPSMEGIIGLSGNQSETAIYGRLNWVDGKAVTTMLFTPTGLGESVVWVDAVFKNTTTSGPYQIKLEKILYLDSVKGQGIECNPSKVHQNTKTDLTITIKEVGTQKRVEGATVEVDGCGVWEKGLSNQDGIFRCTIKPTETGEITIRVRKENLIGDSITIPVFPEQIKLFLDIDPVKSPTKQSQMAISGYSSVGAIITCQSQSKEVAENGTFTLEGIHIEEGMNAILVQASYEEQTVKKLVEVVRDTTPPSLLVNVPEEKLIDKNSWNFTGRTEPGSIVKANGIEAKVVHDLFQVELPLQLGVNSITFTADDILGNRTEEKVTVYNWHETLIQLGIGKETATINDEIAVLDAPPFIIEGRTFVPVRFIAESFGADVEWLKETETIIIKTADTTISMQIGNRIAMVNASVHQMDAPPVIQNGRTFVPVRFIAESFGADVEWVKETETILIRKLQ